LLVYVRYAVGDDLVTTKLRITPCTRAIIKLRQRMRDVAIGLKSASQAFDCEFETVH
jgi:hypothetical protein